MCALINDVALVTLVQRSMDDMSCCKVFGADYRLIPSLNLFLSLLLYRQKEQKLCTWCNYSLSQSLR